jgi:hypothetical protein
MSTSALTVRCQNCGAPLKVSDGIRFMTCNYCKAELELVRDTSATHTRLLEKLQADTRQMRGSLRILEIQNELERLDRDWEAWRQENLTRSQSGEYFEPNRFLATLFPLLILVAGSLLAITRQGLLAFVLVMLVTLGLSGFLLHLLLDTCRRYAAANKRYEELRQQLLFRLKQERQQAE